MVLALSGDSTVLSSVNGDSTVILLLCLLARVSPQALLCRWLVVPVTPLVLSGLSPISALAYSSWPLRSVRLKKVSVVCSRSLVSCYLPLFSRSVSSNPT